MLNDIHAIKNILVSFYLWVILIEICFLYYNQHADNYLSN